MAAEKEASCHSCTSDPNFAIICSFLDKFAQTCGIVHPTFSELQEMLEDTNEVAQQLVDLHIKLMRKARKTCTAEKWEKALIKFCHSYSSQDGWELERFGYKKSRVGVKLRLLKTLLEAQFDSNSKFKVEVNKLSSNELRCEPLGKDVNGHTYWCQFDPAAHVRIYREDPDEETWEMIAKDRIGLVALIDSLSSGEGQQELNQILNEDSNSLEIEKPIIDTGQVEETTGEEGETDEGTSVDSKEYSDNKDSANEECTMEMKLKKKDNITVNDQEVQNSCKTVSDQQENNNFVNQENENSDSKTEISEPTNNTPAVNGVNHVDAFTSERIEGQISSSSAVELHEESSTNSEIHEDSSNAIETQENSNTMPEPEESDSNNLEDNNIPCEKQDKKSTFEEEEELALQEDKPVVLESSRNKMESVITNGVLPLNTSVITTTNGNSRVEDFCNSNLGSYGIDLSRKSAEENPQRGIPVRSNLGFKKSKGPPGSKLDEIFKLKRGYNLATHTNLPPQSQPLHPYMVGMNHKDLLSQMSERFNEHSSYHSHEQRLEATVSHKRGPEDLSVNSNKRVHLEKQESPIVGEAIEEPMMLIKGLGSGQDCDMGNPGREADTPDSASTATTNVCNKVPDTYCQSSSNSSNIEETSTKSLPVDNASAPQSTPEKKTPKLWSIDTICSPEKPNCDTSSKPVCDSQAISPALFFFGPGSLQKTVDINFIGDPCTTEDSHLMINNSKHNLNEELLKTSDVEASSVNNFKNDQFDNVADESEEVTSVSENDTSDSVCRNSENSSNISKEETISNCDLLKNESVNTTVSNSDNSIIFVKNQSGPEIKNDAVISESTTTSEKDINNIKYNVDNNPIDKTNNTLETSNVDLRIGSKPNIVECDLPNKTNINDIKVHLNKDNSPVNYPIEQSLENASEKCILNGNLKSDSKVETERSSSHTVTDILDNVDTSYPSSESDRKLDAESESVGNIVEPAKLNQVVGAKSEDSECSVKNINENSSGLDTQENNCTEIKKEDNTCDNPVVRDKNIKTDEPASEPKDKVVEAKSIIEEEDDTIQNLHEQVDSSGVSIKVEKASENNESEICLETKIKQNNLKSPENEESVNSTESISEARSGRKSRTNSTCNSNDISNEVPNKIRKTSENASVNADEEKLKNDSKPPKSVPTRRTSRRNSSRGSQASSRKSQESIEKEDTKEKDNSDNQDIDSDDMSKKLTPQKSKEIEEKETKSAQIGNKEPEESKKINCGFSLATFSLDVSDELLYEPEKHKKKPAKETVLENSRKRRGRSSKSEEDGTPEEEEENDEEIVEAGGKKPRLRGKARKAKQSTARKKAEEQRAEKMSSSSEEEDEEEVDDEDEEEGTNEEGKTKGRHTPIKSRGRGRGGNRARGRGRGGRGRGGRGRGRAQTTKQTVDSPNTPSNDEVVTPKRAKKGQTLMGLYASDLKHAEILNSEGGRSVRQSRRIAQIKLKEQAERRAIEEATILSLKELEMEERRKRKEEKKEKKKNKKNKKGKPQKVSDCDYSAGEQEVSEGKRKTRKRRKRKGLKYDINNPWRSSSGSSSSDEEEEEEDHYEDEDDEDDFVKPPVVSDHEFSPESDLEKDGEIEPTRRARTAQKGEEEETPTEEYACQKCGQQDHPEWILLCDKCDNGWHASCLRPPLMLVPEGDWFCPPCQHAQLVIKLKETLRMFERDSKRRENEELRRKRLAYVGISLANVLPTQKQGKLAGGGKLEQDESKGERSSTETSYEGSSSGEEDSSEEEPVYQLRQRRAATNLTYRFNEFDDLINSAIQDEMEAVKGAGNQGRGKDISTIVNAEKEEKLNATNENKQEDEKDVPEEEQEIEEEGWKPPVVPKKSSLPSGRKKTRRLNSLDVSSGDDTDSDEDFKGTSEEEEEDESIDDDSDGSGVGGKWKRSRNQPVRRSTRARTSRIDAEFINDDSEESDEPRRKKKRHIWQESETEDSDTTWGKKKRKPRAYIKPKSKGRKKKTNKFFDESDSDTPKKPKIKKPKIKYGLIEEEEDIGRRTRGKKINYQEVAGSDTEEEVLNKSKVDDSEDEFVLENEVKDSADESPEENIPDENAAEEDDEDEDKEENDEEREDKKERKEKNEVSKSDKKETKEAEVKEKSEEGEEEVDEEEEEEEEDECDDDDEEEEEETNNVTVISNPDASQIETKLKIRKIEEISAEAESEQRQQGRLRIKSHSDLQAEVVEPTKFQQNKIPFVSPIQEVTEQKAEEEIKQEEKTNSIRVVSPQKLMASPVVEESERHHDSIIKAMLQHLQQEKQQQQQQQLQGYYNRVEYGRGVRPMYQGQGPPPSVRNSTAGPQQFSGGGQRVIRGVYPGNQGGHHPLEPPPSAPVTITKTGDQQRYMYGPPPPSYHPPPPPNYYPQHYSHQDDPGYPTEYHTDAGDRSVHPSFEEEGEFGGLVSYFSSQREDNLDT